MLLSHCLTLSKKGGLASTSWALDGDDAGLDGDGDAIGDGELLAFVNVQHGGGCAGDVVVVVVEGKRGVESLQFDISGFAGLWISPCGSREFYSQVKTQVIVGKRGPLIFRSGLRYSISVSGLSLHRRHDNC